MAKLGKEELDRWLPAELEVVEKKPDVIKS
jgi:hypothetical protein